MVENNFQKEDNIASYRRNYLSLDNFPIGYSLDHVIAFEDKEFAGEELCLDKIELVFRNKNYLGEVDFVILTLIPDPDTDEIIVFPTKNKLKLLEYLEPEADISDSCDWCQPFISKKLQAAWICENNQGYQDQIIFAFERLHPSLAFVAEGSVIKVFSYEQVEREKIASSLVKQDN